MKKYDYEKAIREDVREYLEDLDFTEWRENRDGLEIVLNDEMRVSDVTGEPSGSYFRAFWPDDEGKWMAEECLAHNWNILLDALHVYGFIDEEYGFVGEDPITHGPEWCDVLIRCFLLGDAISDVLDEYEKSGAFDAPKYEG